MDENVRQEPEESQALKHRLLTDWNVAKENFHFTPERKLQLVRNGEIWWVGIGENVGVEINGKSGFFRARCWC